MLALHAGEYRDSGGAGRLIAVKSPPLDLLRGVSSPHGSNISHFTSEDQLLQAYHIPFTVQQRYRYELLDDHPQRAPAENSALMHDSCEPADSGRIFCRYCMAACSKALRRGGRYIFASFCDCMRHTAMLKPASLLGRCCRV